MSDPSAERHAHDREALLRRIGWERRGFRVLRLVLAAAFIARGVRVFTEFDGASWVGIVMIGFGAWVLWGLFSGDEDEPTEAQTLSLEQRNVLARTIEGEGRMAAVKQLRVWTGATYAEATRDIDAAFPDQAE